MLNHPLVGLPLPLFCIKGKRTTNLKCRKYEKDGFNIDDGCHDSRYRKGTESKFVQSQVRKSDLYGL